MQVVRDSPIYLPEDTVAMMHIDNQQAWIQSRLIDMPRDEYIQECCRLAAYLCAAMLCCKLWRTSIVPVSPKLPLSIQSTDNSWPQPSISAQLFQLLQRRQSYNPWEGHEDLLIWLLFVGGGCSSEGAVRSGYIKLVQDEYFTDISSAISSWPDLLENLQDFVWSHKVFEPRVKVFWNQAVFNGF
jgi:hypothetical protein